MTDNPPTRPDPGAPCPREEWPRLARDRSRDLALLAFAGLVMLALLAWRMG